jgi:hypothetical protein
VIRLAYNPGSLGNFDVITFLVSHATSCCYNKRIICFRHRNSTRIAETDVR